MKNKQVSLLDMIKLRDNEPLSKQYIQYLCGISEQSYRHQEVLDIYNLVNATLLQDAKYEGYLQKGLEQIEKAKKLEEKTLPDDIDYLSIGGLRLEARQKLDKIRPKNLGQAGRISGVSPADIAVLMVYLKK